MEFRRSVEMRILSVPLYVCPSVRLSVRLSVKHLDFDTMKERSDQIFIPYESAFSIVF